jgi:hypothetical protein
MKNLWWVEKTPMITDSNQACFAKMSGCELQEEVNEATVQYVGGGFGHPKNGDFLPRSTSSQKLRFERDIKPLNEARIFLNSLSMEKEYTFVQPLTRSSTASSHFLSFQPP